MAELVKPWWQAPTGYVFFIAEGGYYYEGEAETYCPHGDKAWVHPTFIDAVLHYKQREYPYFGRGRVMKVVYGQRVPPEVNYIAELKSGMFEELENTSVFLCLAAYVTHDKDSFKVSTYPYEKLKPFPSLTGKIKSKIPATAKDLLDTFAEDNKIRLVEYDEYLPFREYYKF